VLALDLAGARPGPGKLYSLHAASFQATNSMTAPEAIRPVESALNLEATHTVPAFTIQVLDIPLH
jgi:hypothetical protein